MGQRYSQLLAGVKGVQLPLAETPYAKNIYWVYGLVLDDDVGFDAEEAMRRLAAKGVGCRPFFFPMHQQPVLRRMGLFADDHHPVAERQYRRGFYIPSGMALTDAQMETVAVAVKELMA
jgi:perosamine synthetase